MFANVASLLSVRRGGDGRDGELYEKPESGAVIRCTPSVRNLSCPSTISHHHGTCDAGPPLCMTPLP